MKPFLICIGLVLLTSDASGKKFKLYHCKQPNGGVVTQDRRCEVTRLQQVKPSASQPKPRPQKHKTKQNPIKTQIASTKIRSTINKLNQNTRRSPYFTFGWDRFIPQNWLLKKIESNLYHQLLLSQKQFTNINDFKTGIKLSVYPKTHQNYQQDAFAKALTLYHQIREKHSKQLINSHYKTHERFKIFNVEYKTNSTTNAFTEFYIDEANNDLFVLTIQAPHNEWNHHQNLADKIIFNL